MAKAATPRKRRQSETETAPPVHFKVLEYFEIDLDDGKGTRCYGEGGLYTIVDGDTALADAVESLALKKKVRLLSSIINQEDDPI